MRIFSNRVPPPPPGTTTEKITYQWVPPGGQPMPVQTILWSPIPFRLTDQEITPVPDGNAAPGIWTLILDVDEHYRLQKRSGADRGIYLNYLAGGFGTVHVAILDGHGNPFSGPVQFTVTPPGGEPFSFTANGSFDADDVDPGTYHVQVVPPSGLSATPADLDFTVSCDRETNLTFVIADLTPPELTLPANITAEATGPSGAQVSFTPTASDFIDGSVPVTCVPASGSTFPLGITQVDCSAADKSGNRATGSFGMTVVDTTPPTFAVSDLTVHATSASGAVVTYTLSATDIVDGTDAVVCTPSSGSTLPIGTTTVSCTATDAHRNATTHTFKVTVYDNPPVCTAAAPSIGLLWPPNHGWVPITINGVTDPDGDALQISVTSILQDEPINGVGDGDMEPDGAGLGTSSARVRAERAGDPKVPGDGRVYHILFTADDGRTGTCSGEVKVGVPRDRSLARSNPVDEGPLYDSVTGVRK